MRKDCCDIKVTEIEGGYRIEVIGNEDVKRRVIECIEACCKGKVSCCVPQEK